MGFQGFPILCVVSEVSWFPQECKERMGFQGFPNMCEMRFHGFLIRPMQFTQSDTVNDTISA